MDQFSASLHNGLLVFGKYPTDAEVNLLKESGYSIFVDLCPSEEITWTPYDRDNITYIDHPIYDRGAPRKDALPLILSLGAKIRQGERVYIHCRGGHGRSATLAAAILIHLTSCTGEEALSRVKEAHAARKEMKPRFRRIGAPQTRIQKEYVKNLSC